MQNHKDFLAIQALPTRSRDPEQRVDAVGRPPEGVAGPATRAGSAGQDHQDIKG